MKRFILLLLGCLTACIILSGCHDALKLDQTQLELTVGDSVELSAGKATRISWESSNDAVATVSGGTVIAKSAGTAVITASLESGEKATCNVTVSDKLIPEITLEDLHPQGLPGQIVEHGGVVPQGQNQISYRQHRITPSAVRPAGRRTRPTGD